MEERYGHLSLSDGTDRNGMGAGMVREIPVPDSRRRQGNAGEHGKIRYDADPPIDPMFATDSVFEMIRRCYPDAASFYINCPDTANSVSVIRVTVYPDSGICCNRDVYAFDRYSLQAIRPERIYGGRYRDADFPSRLFRSVYDLHTGAYMWYKRRKRRKT
jgi:hypothetical protein